MYCGPPSTHRSSDNINRPIFLQFKLSPHPPCPSKLLVSPSLLSYIVVVTSAHLRRRQSTYEHQRNQNAGLLRRLLAPSRLRRCSKLDRQWRQLSTVRSCHSLYQRMLYSGSRRRRLLLFVSPQDSALHLCLTSRPSTMYLARTCPASVSRLLSHRRLEHVFRPTVLHRIKPLPTASTQLFALLVSPIIRPCPLSSR